MRVDTVMRDKVAPTTRLRRPGFFIEMNFLSLCHLSRTCEIVYFLTIMIMAVVSLDSKKKDP